MQTSTLSKDAPFDNLLDGMTLAHAIIDTMRDPRRKRDNQTARAETGAAQAKVP